MCFFLALVFFFKQKTAYEMRISDWSSDVCSSDLAVPGQRRLSRQITGRPDLMPLRTLIDPHHLPALNPAYALRRPALGLGPNDPPPRILLLYGSLRQRSFSRLCIEEAARLLHYFGAETRIFDPAELPMPDQV